MWLDINRLTGGKTHRVRKLLGVNFPVTAQFNIPTQGKEPRKYRMTVPASLQRRSCRWHAVAVQEVFAGHS